jgi:predicted RND superfamily exporter protein
VQQRLTCPRIRSSFLCCKTLPLDEFSNTEVLVVAVFFHKRRFPISKFGVLSSSVANPCVAMSRLDRDSNNNTNINDVLPDGDLGSRAFRAWATFLLHHRWFFLILSLGITLLFGKFMVTGLEVNTDFERFLDSESEVIKVVDELRDTFGQDQPFIFNIRGDVFSIDYLNRLKALHQELESLEMDIESLGERRRVRKDADKRPPPSQPPFEQNANLDQFPEEEGWGDETKGSIVEEIVSLINVRQVSWRSGSLKVAGLLDDWPSPEELPSLKKKVLADESLVGRVIDADGAHSVIMVRTDFMLEADLRRVHREMVRIGKAHRADGFEVMVTGMPTVSDTVHELILSDQARVTASAFSVVIIIAFFIFRHPLGVLGPFLVVVFADIWVLGLMGLVRVPITTTTSMITAFIACVGTGDAIHVQSVYRNARRNGVANQDAIIHSISITGVPVLYTSITTAIGLLSLILADLGGIGEMGVFSAFGVTAALINSLVLLPIVLSVNRKSLLGASHSVEKESRIDRFLDFCNGLSRPKEVNGKLSYTRRNIVLSIAAGATIFIFIGLSMLQAYHETLSWFPKDHSLYRNVKEFENSIGGMASANLLIEANHNKNLKDREILQALEALEKHIESYTPEDSAERFVHNSISMLDIIRESWRAVNDDKPEYNKLPDTQQGVYDMITLFESASPDDLKRLVTIDMKKAVMIARVKWMNAMAYEPLVAYIQRGIDKYVGDKASVKITGSVIVAADIISSLVLDMLKSFGGAIFIITLIMISLLKGIKLGTLAMIPNLIPVLSVMALMGFLSIYLDTATVMLGSLAIGIVVDDTIHYLHQFKAHYDKHKDVERAIKYSFDHTGRAMIITSIMLATAFMCNEIAVLLCYKITGLLLSSIIVLAIFIDLCLCPAILRAIYK